MAGAANGASVLLFDLGGVLVRTSTFSRLKALVDQAGDGWKGDGQALRARWLASPSVRSFELGQVTCQVFAERFVEEWSLTVSPESLAGSMAPWIDGPFPGAEELVGSLQRRGYHVSCLSNCNELHWAEIAPFVKRLDSAFSSHLLGKIKPDADAYLAVAERLGVAPERIWFFDDSLPNVQAAQRLGIRSFLVDGPQAARAVLMAEGLL